MSEPSDKEEVVDFGFKKVPKSDKTLLVQQVFTSVADRYNLMNDLMSLGLHRRWKNSLIQRLHLRNDMTVFDVASGTGDISMGIARRAKKKEISINLISVDLTESMLRIGRNNSLDKGFVSDISWINADGAHLPVGTKSIDAYTIAFGIRNMTDLTSALDEAYRVLRPGGQFLCLEFSRISPSLETLYNAYSFNVMPMLGKIISNDKKSYTYLVESIRKFPDQTEFIEYCNNAKFSNINCQRLSGGIATIYSAWRL